MYDVNFGGIEQMTKRLTIALVAVALFVLLAVMPVAAVTTTNPNGTQIDLGATVFIGEQGLNLTHALNAATTGFDGLTFPVYDGVPGNLTIGWWASAAQITTSAPTKTINLQGGRYTNFQVAPSDFVGYTGNWYLLKSDGTTAQTGTLGTNPVSVINVQDPTLVIGAWDFTQGKDVTGLSVPQGTHLGVLVNTNMYSATYPNRNNTVATETGYAAGLGGNYFINPNGNIATWAGSNGDSNFTGRSNGSFVFTTYPGQVASNVWLVENFTAAGTSVLTTYGMKYPAGTYSIAYWNNSAADNFYDGAAWTGMNFTSDLNGIVSTQDASAWQSISTTVPSVAPFAGTDGFINIKVKDESGTTLTKLLIGAATNDANSPGFQNYTSVSTQTQFVNTQPWYLGTATHDANNVGYWVTDALDTNNQYAYPVGTYSVWAESALNNMKDNYRNAGADYTGKTVSPVGTVTLVSDTVKIEANKDSVVRSKSFSVTVTGKPSTTYYVWVKGTSSMDSTYDNQPPMININQEKVYFDPTTGRLLPDGKFHYLIGEYQYDNGAKKTIRDDVATGDQFNSTRYYALINTTTSGTRTVEWVTNNWTKAQKYTIRVEQNFPTDANGYGSGYQAAGSTVKSDEVDINVEKGAVTIVAAGDQSYYLGEEIQFSGTNTETYKTYLFMVGPNLPAQGAVIANADPRNALVGDGIHTTKGVVTGDVSTFKAIDVNGDNTWSWKWGTSNYALDAGTYTIYAVSQPYDKNSLANAAYGTVSIIIKKPFVSATASQSTVAKGDRIYITGTAEGQPSSVAIWILGKNYATRTTTAVNSDASFSYEVKQEDTRNLASGQYFVVVQHPMQNNIFDVDLDTSTTSSTYGYVVNKKLQSQNGAGTPTAIFQLLGAGSLQGSDAAEALAQGINDANVDDTYTKLQFLVEEPVIRIDAIGDKHVGDKFTVTAQTNLAVDDEVLVQIYSSSFKPTEKSQSGEFSGATGTVKVTKGDSGMNKLSFDVDSSTFKPDEYIVTESAVIQDATGTALFNVLETSVTVSPTATPVVAITTEAPTQVQTAVVTTAAPTAAPTKSPGYGALIALIGLGAVAFIVVRRH
jgi:trimeric autotransporter adhesin